MLQYTYAGPAAVTRLLIVAAAIADESDRVPCRRGAAVGCGGLSNNRSRRCRCRLRARCCCSAWNGPATCATCAAWLAVHAASNQQVCRAQHSTVQHSTASALCIEAADEQPGGYESAEKHRVDRHVVEASRHDAEPNTHAPRSARSTSAGFSICTAITASSH
jgi:hypothetical protein